MFKIEYLPPCDSADCPLIRLYGFRSEDVASLRASCESLAGGHRDECMLTDEPWTQSINGCRLLLRADPSDQSARTPRRRDTTCRVAQPKPGAPILMTGSREAWRDVADLLDPFTRTDIQGSDSFTWLADFPEIKVLVSTSGRWEPSLLCLFLTP